MHAPPVVMMPYIHLDFLSFLLGKETEAKCHGWYMKTNTYTEKVEKKKEKKQGRRKGLL